MDLRQQILTDDVIIAAEVDAIDDRQDVFEVVAGGAHRHVAHHVLVAHALVGEDAGDGARQRRAGQRGEAGQQPPAYELDQVIDFPGRQLCGAGPGVPGQVALEHRFVVLALAQRGLRQALLLLLVQKLEEEEPGQVFGVLHLSLIHISEPTRPY